MNLVKKILQRISSAKQKFFPEKTNTVPLLIIKKEKANENIREYNSVEEAIADLEKDSNVSSEKIERLKIALRSLKNKTTIKIMNGEIIK